MKEKHLDGVAIMQMSQFTLHARAYFHRNIHIPIWNVCRVHL